MKKILYSIVFFMISFAASWLTFFVLNVGAITLNMYIVATVLGTVSAVRAFIRYNKE